ncbi:unnamed protein product [Notodromas monacha]|uniref:Dedicator of cytokinesis protein n=2 Tax=Notodromas monacha TaxID=399045 RepID=A0A7R9BI73_9CRUS|nr:unnamed protein product [Notodromas monacha]CAG0914598.1 unnamed protein product [Notodromas monacha]
MFGTKTNVYLAVIHRSERAFGPERMTTLPLLLHAAALVVERAVCHAGTFVLLVTFFTVQRICLPHAANFLVDSFVIPLLTKHVRDKMERKFTKGLIRPGMAAQLRETVSQVVKETENQTKLARAEPVDYEAFMNKHKTLIVNDVDRDMLLFPQDDVSLKSVPRECRTSVPTVTGEMVSNSSSVFVKECLKSYLAEWKVVDYKYAQFSGPYLNLPRFPRTLNLQELVYEIDLDNEDAESVTLGGVACPEAVAKEGYLLKGPEGGGDWLFGNIGSKALKRRFARLRQSGDGTYLLEFTKDDQPKGTIVLDFAREVTRATRRGRNAFEIRTGSGAGRKNYILAAETEEDLVDWLEKLGRVITQNARLDGGIRTMPTPPLCTLPSSDLGIDCDGHFATLRGLEQSLNPQLTKYAKETEATISHRRKENRQGLFHVYPDMPRCPVEEPPSLEDQAPPWQEGHGYGLKVAFKDIKLFFKLCCPSTNSPGTPVEPYYTSVALFDARIGIKLSEDFHFDVNPNSVKELVENEERTPGESVISALPHLEGLSVEWLSAADQALFSIMSSSKSDIYIVLRIEKILQGGLVSVAEPYIRNPSQKNGEKVQKAFHAYAQRLGQYKMPFAWATCPLFSLNGKLDTSQRTLSLYRVDPCKFSDADLVRLLPDVKRLEKESKLPRIPGYFSFRLERILGVPSNTLTSSLMPVIPFPIPATHPMTLEVQEFPSSRVEQSSPHLSFFNMLYVYPLSLKYDGQKTFSRARNIACSVQLKNSDAEDAQPLLAAVGRSGESILNYRTVTSVSHHSPNPDFYLEAKFLLPPEVSSKMHLLFTFSHVSCEPAKKRESVVESVVGYAWLMLSENGRLNIGDHHLSVAAALPPGYLSVEHLGLCKGFVGPEIKWVDNQKPLFLLRVTTVSSVHCPDSHMHAFFAQLPLDVLLGERSKEKEGKSLSDVTKEVSKFVKALHAVEPCWLLRYLQPVLCRLFSLLIVCPNDEDIQLSVAKTAVHIVHQAEMAEHQDTMLAYTKYVFDLDALATGAMKEMKEGDDGVTLHEQMCRALTLLLRPANTDALVINKFLRHTGFFFRLLAKTMAQYLLITGRIKMQRHERFSGDFHYRLQSLLQALSPHIIQKHKDLAPETREANFCVAHFIKRCMSLTDRGFAFRLIAFYMEKFGPGDPQLLHEFKFDFIREIISHEHYVPLNLPVIPGKRTKEEMASKFVLTPDFLSQHYLSGVLLKELKFALNDFPATRRLAVNILRNILAKHSFDERYRNDSQQGRIAMLYLPLITIVLENVSRLDTADPGNAGKTGTIVTDTHSRSQSQALSFTESNFSAGTSTISSRSSFVESVALSTESSVLDMIAGGTTLPAGCKLSVTGAIIPPAANSPSNLRFRRHHRGSECTLTNGSIGGVESVLDEEDEPDGEDDDTPTPTGASPAATRSSATSISTSTEKSTHRRVASMVTAQNFRKDKLTTGEVKELLLCFLWVVKHVPQEFLLAWWKHAANDDIWAFFRVIEVPSMVTAQNFRKDKLTTGEVKELLLCFLWVVKHVPQEFLLAWWKHAANDDIWAFFRVIELALMEFRYRGRSSAQKYPNHSPGRGHTYQSSGSASLQSKFASWRSGSDIGDGDTLRSEHGTAASTPRNSVGGHGYPALVPEQEAPLGPADHCVMEGHLAAELGMIALDCLGLYSSHFSNRLLADCGTGVGRNQLMRKCFDIYLYFLQVSHAESVMEHAFAAWRAFLNAYSSQVLFGGDGELCGLLCYELLKACNSKLASTRSDAAAVLYLLMRSNFELSQRKSMTRVHLQTIIGVSRLLSEVVSLNSPRFQESLSRLNSLAAADSAMRNTGLRSAVCEVTRRVRAVLMATSQLREAAADPETMADLQLRLAASYAATPQLRQTWLESLAKVQARAGHASEVAMCHVHVAALMAEVLRHTEAGFRIGAADFASVSPNVPLEEALSLKETTAEMQEIPYTEDTVVEELIKAAEWFEKSERWECLLEVYRLVTPFYEAKRDFAALSECFSRLQFACKKVSDSNYAKRRLLGTYFRVAFYGEGFFDAMSGRSFLYKEPKVTSLAEFSERIMDIFTEKFGKGVVRIIQDSSPVNLDELDPQMAHIQITHVTPFFDEHESVTRVSEFERNHNISRFVFETPFTVDGNRAHGKIEDQWKRKTILTTSHWFPYMSKRVDVVTQQVEELSPIEVAAEEMSARVAGLKLVVHAHPPDIKRLQLLLQGSISVQVNAGPLAYAQSFLTPEAEDCYPSTQVAILKDIFRQFIAICGVALDLNESLIQSVQRDYQAALRQSYGRLRTSLADLIGSGSASLSTAGLESPLLGNSLARVNTRSSIHSNTSSRTSSTLFSVISGTSGSSDA